MTGGMLAAVVFEKNFAVVVRFFILDSLGFFGAIILVIESNYTRGFLCIFRKLENLLKCNVLFYKLL